MVTLENDYKINSMLQSTKFFFLKYETVDFLQETFSRNVICHQSHTWIFRKAF